MKTQQIMALSHDYVVAVERRDFALIESTKVALEVGIEALVQDRDTLKGELALWANPERSVIREMAALAQENKVLRAAAQRVAKHDEEDASVAWRLAGQLLKQAQAENEECAYWFVSALSKLAASHPQRPVMEVLVLARHAMPTAAKQYRDYVADKC